MLCRWLSISILPLALTGACTGSDASTVVLPADTAAVDDSGDVAFDSTDTASAFDTETSSPDSSDSAVDVPDFEADIGTCPDTLTACKDGDGVVRCVDLLVEPCHCGACGSRCAYCYGGGCSGCGAGIVPCGGPTETTCVSGTRPKCVDRVSDKMNCGACGNSCAAGQECVLAKCVTVG